MEFGNGDILGFKILQDNPDSGLVFASVPLLAFKEGVGVVAFAFRQKEHP
jgi:hypothetical protein